MQDLLMILHNEFKDNIKVAKNSQPRDVAFSRLNNKIKVAVGMRRVGKTYFVYQTIWQLINEQKIPWSRILYLNFEDDRLFPCSQHQFRDLLESFYQLYPDNHDQLCYLFFDEIQNVKDWPLVVRRFFDTKKVQIYLTGSSSKLLSTEIATSLRGRSIATEVWPYNLAEYLSANKIVIEKELFGQKERDMMHFNLKKYLNEGGFPESIGIPQSERRQLLQDYVELVVMRDVIERHNVTNISLIRYLIKTLLKNVGSQFSVSKFTNDIRSQGLTSTRNTIYDYLSYIEDAYLCFSVPLFNESLKKVQANSKKTYAIDPGVVQAYSFSLNNNYGHIFENLIFLDLKRQGSKVYYYLTEERYEVDFLAQDRQGKAKLYQVVWDISDEKTLQREKRALDVAKKELNLPGEIITPEVYLKTLYQSLI